MPDIFIMPLPNGTESLPMLQRQERFHAMQTPKLDNKYLKEYDKEENP